MSQGKGSKPRSGHSPTTYHDNYDDIFSSKASVEDTEVSQQEIDQQEAIAQVLEQLTGVAYDTYSDAVGGVAYNGDKLPDWDEFGDDPNKTKQADAWRIAVKAVVDQISG
jgi:hypothetical protein